MTRSVNGGSWDGPAPAAPGRLGIRHARGERTGSRERSGLEQLPPAYDPVVHSGGEVTIRPVTLEPVREQVAAASRRLAAEGLVLGTAGNVSARSGDEVAITPTGAVLAELESEQVSVVDLDGNQVDGELAPTSELDLHLGVYRRYEAGAVVHTHAPMARGTDEEADDRVSLGKPPRVHLRALP